MYLSKLGFAFRVHWSFSFQHHRFYRVFRNKRIHTFIKRQNNILQCVNLHKQEVNDISKLPSLFLSSLGISSHFVWLLLCPLFLLGAGGLFVSSSFSSSFIWPRVMFWPFTPKALVTASNKHIQLKCCQSQRAWMKSLRPNPSVSQSWFKRCSWFVVLLYCITTDGLSNFCTWFDGLTANPPLVFGHRINLQHFLQVNVIRLARVQRQMDRGGPRCHRGVQEGAGGGRVWFPVSTVSFPVPH